MYILSKLIKTIKASMIRVSWPFLFFMVLLHSSSSWMFMSMGGEEAAESLTLWVYYYVTTASTVGYGDYSPSSPLGQWATALYLIPGSIALFAALIGKITVIVNRVWRKYMQGKSDYSNLVEHTLIIGWHGETTEQIIDILNNDKGFTKDIVLCVTKDIDNPMPGEVKFVKGESFSNEHLLRRAGVSTASRIIIYDDQDDRVVAIALSVYNMKSESCHVVAHCDNSNTASMLQRTLPGIECTKSMSLEMLVRSATDAGISRVVNELLCVDKGATQYQVKLMYIPEGKTYGELFYALKAEHNATLLGVMSEGEEGILNQRNDKVLRHGDMVYYMSDKRLPYTTFMSILGGIAETDTTIVATS